MTAFQHATRPRPAGVQYIGGEDTFLASLQDNGRAPVILDPAADLGDAIDHIRALAARIGVDVAIRRLKARVRTVEVSVRP